MSELELEALIATVSADIERQTEVLRGLHREKSHLLRQLNAMRDPIAKLPLEIAAEIFLQCIDIDLPKPEGFPELLTRWLQWASNRPLKIFVKGYMEPRVASVIWLHWRQLKSLHIHFSTVSMEDYYLKDGCDYKALGDTIPQVPFPCLQELTRKLRGMPIFQLLRSSPNLVSLDFRNMPCIWGADVPKQPSVRVLELEHVKIGDFERLAEFFALLPTIDHLKLRNRRAGDVAELLGILMQPAASLVPNLRILEISYDGASHHPASDSQWGALATSLGVCFGRIPIIRLTAARGLIEASEGTLAVFRELGAAGDIRLVDGGGKDLF
ncbi:hypothetical protein FB45DRAFT_886267 [Roridomyces roridus]|uniref:F-box domain-containing protein n=1 Tax=Roridomyces roridus TaxID=1738132 RepID=A0AAD7CIT8_9AGAR|nr:hypothetical protein FB45DRAFT_886267 [Roridomyces roridus]